MTAFYSGDGNYAASNSTTVTQTVTAAPLNLSGPAFYLREDADNLHLDIWTNATGRGRVRPADFVVGRQQHFRAGDDRQRRLLSSIFPADFSCPPVVLTDTGAGTSGTLTVIGSTGNDTVSASTGGITIDGATINTSNLAKTIFTPGAGHRFGDGVVWLADDRGTFGGRGFEPGAVGRVGGFDEQRPDRTRRKFVGP